MTPAQHAPLHDAWPLRPWLLGALGLLCGAWFDHMRWHGPELGWTASLIVGPAVALFALAFTLERARWRWSLLFSFGLALLLAVLARWVVGAQPDASFGTESMMLTPRLSAGTLFGLLSIPFFQTLQQEPKLHPRLWKLPYYRLHDAAWSDVVMFFAAWIFLALVGILLLLWGQLFKLIGVSFFADIFSKSGFLWPVLTAAWVVGVALLRDWPRVVLPLRGLVLTILSVLAPILAAITLLWIVFVPFTGLAPLWATRSATPILLMVMAFALLLANAVIRDEPQDEPKSRLLRSSGRILGAVLLPLCIIAAMSLFLRIKQYGWTPERCYAALFIAIAMFYATSYAVLLLTRWRQWTDSVRRANIKLSLVTMALALLVSTPLMDVERVSANSQIYRLLSGRTPVDKFDFAALKFRMGKAGLRALETLRTLPATHPQAAAIKTQLAVVDKADSYWQVGRKVGIDEAKAEQARMFAAFDQMIDVYPPKASLPEGLKSAAVQRLPEQCFMLPAKQNTKTDRCSLLLADVVPGGALEAFAFEPRCADCPTGVSLFRAQDGKWDRIFSMNQRTVQPNGLAAALEAGRFSLTPAPFKILQIGGQTIVIDPDIRAQSVSKP
jgi:hypothetical protein